MNEDSCSIDDFEPGVELRIFHHSHPLSSRLERVGQRYKSSIHFCPCSEQIFSGACSSDSITGLNYCCLSCLSGSRGPGGFAGKGRRRPPRRQSQSLHWRGSKVFCQRQCLPYPRTTPLRQLPGENLHSQTWLARCPPCSQSRCKSKAIRVLFDSFARANSPG